MFGTQLWRMSDEQERRREAPCAVHVGVQASAVRLVKAGQEASVTARVLGMTKATLSNWVRASEKSELQGAGDKPVSAEQMELARLRAELARVKMERDILKNRPRGLARPFWIETRSVDAAGAPVNRPLAFWRRPSPSLVGNYQAEHVFELTQALALCHFYQLRLDECDAEIERTFAELNADKQSPAEPVPKARHKTVQPNAVNFDTRPSLYQLTGVDLTQIHGIGPYLALRMVAECGTNLSKWPTAKHLAQLIALRASAWMQQAAATLPAEWRRNYLVRAPVLETLPPRERGLLTMARP